MNATLPAGRASADHSIASMDVGEVGWTVPWAMFHDDQRRLWLNGSYTIDAHPMGTAKMRVCRDESGWHVNASACPDHQWGQGNYSGSFPSVAVASFDV